VSAASRPAFLAGSVLQHLRELSLDALLSASATPRAPLAAACLRTRCRRAWRARGRARRSSTFGHLVTTPADDCGDDVGGRTTAPVLTNSPGARVLHADGASYGSALRNFVIAALRRVQLRLAASAAALRRPSPIADPTAPTQSPATHVVVERLNRGLN